MTCISDTKAPSDSDKQKEDPIGPQKYQMYLLEFWGFRKHLKRTTLQSEVNCLY